MNRLTLFKLLRGHRKLAEKRAMNLQQTRTAKIMMVFMTALIIFYLIGFAVMFALIANDSRTVTSVEMMMSLAPIILLVDFGVRFMAQQTPSQIVKPYILLPISKYACMDVFIATSILNTGNLIWFTMLIPFCFMSVIFSYGIWLTLGFLFLWWLMIITNSQWYLIVRTLVLDSQLWWLLPLCVYALISLPLYIGADAGWEHLFDTYAKVGTAMHEGSLLPYLMVIAALTILVIINRKLQYKHVWAELSKTETTRLRSVTKLSFLDKYGEIGEYFKLEVKTILRNKNPRKTFISATAIVLVFSIIIATTNVYDSQIMTNFWCVYNFVIYGATMLVKIMGNEGNYIDALMVHKENILSLFKAKYIFYCLMLVFPFLLMLPPVIIGKWSILMLASMAVFTAGFQYFLLFQMAVYNKQTIPLNTKFISKAGLENNYVQVVAEIIAFTVPIVIISLLQAVFSDTVAYLITLLIGLVFIVTHPLWLRNIYNRFIKRRYENIEALRASR